jgi:hypothetical protein
MKKKFSKGAGQEALKLTEKIETVAAAQSYIFNHS